MAAYEQENAKEWQMSSVGRVVKEAEDSGDEELDEHINTGTHPSFAAKPPILAASEISIFTGPSVRLPVTVSSRPATNNVAAAVSRIAPDNGASVRNIRPLQQARGLPAWLPYERDNAATTAWKARKPHNGVFRMPEDYFELARKHYGNDVEGLKKSPFAPLVEIGVRTGTHILQPKSSRELTLLIWGTSLQIKRAQDALHNWIARARKKTLIKAIDRGMPSVHPITEKQKNRLKRDVDNAASRQKYRQKPEEGRTFPVTGMYLWSTEGARPQDVFGSGCEAFDWIRSFYGCYITFDQQLCTFKVLCDGKIHPSYEKMVESAKEAISQIGVTISEYAARSSGPLHRYLVAPLNHRNYRKEVEILCLQKPGTENPEALTNFPSLTGNRATQDEIDVLNEWHIHLSRENKLEMQRTTLSCIKRLQYYRGQLRMRVLLGVFALNNYYWMPPKAPTIPIRDFVENMCKTGTKGTLYKNLTAVYGYDDLFDRTRQAINVFEPSDVMTHSLHHVMPTYDAMFEFVDKDSGHVRLEVAMKKVHPSSNAFETIQKRWTRMDRLNAVRRSDGSMEVNHPLEIYIIRLLRGVTWKLQISADNNVDASRVTPDMADFAAAVHCTMTTPIDVSIEQGQRMFAYPASDLLRHFEQKTSWKYRLKLHNTYIFELARYDTFDTRLGNANASDVKPTNTSWAASMYDGNWDSLLGQNGRLEVGEAVKWTPDLETFFPKIFAAGASEQGGFDNFLQTVQAVVDFLNESENA